MENWTFKSRRILQMRSSLHCSRVSSFIAGTKLMRPQIKCIESVCNNLFLCFVKHVYNYIKTFHIRLAGLSNSSKSQDVLKDNTILTAQYSVLSPQRRCEGSVMDRGRSVLLSVSLSWSTHSYDFFFLWRCDPTRVMASSFLRFSRSHKTTHHSR